MTSASGLSGRWCALRPYQPRDLEYLYTLSTSPDIAHLGRLGGLTPPIEDFERDLRTNFIHFVVTDASGQQLCGHVMAYRASLIHGVAYIGLLIEADAHRRGVGIEAAFLLINYMFQTFPFRKLFAEVAGTSLATFASAERFGFRREATLDEFVYYGDAYHDLAIFSVARGDFVGAVNRMLPAEIRGDPNPATN